MDIAKSINDDDQETIPIETLQTLVVGKKRFSKVLPKIYQDNATEYNPEDPFAGKPTDPYSSAFLQILLPVPSCLSETDMFFLALTS